MSGLFRGPEPFFVGALHLLPTPGSPAFGGSLERVLERAVEDGRALARGAADGALVENFGDAPFYGERVPPETVASLALAVAALRREVPELTLGVNCLRNDARAALGICAATGAAFLRVNVHVGAMVTDQGLLEGRAAETLRERARLAPGALLFADVHVKHASPLGSESLGEAAQETWARGRADALVLSGRRTGDPPGADELAQVRERVPAAPLWVGSGLTAENAPALLPLAQGAIVGTWLAAGADPDAPLDADRVGRLRELFDSVRAGRSNRAAGAP